MYVYIYNIITSLLTVVFADNIVPRSGLYIFRSLHLSPRSLHPPHHPFVVTSRSSLSRLVAVLKIPYIRSCVCFDHTCGIIVTILYILVYPEKSCCNRIYPQSDRDVEIKWLSFIYPYR
jgi:hypothetical protein